MTAKQQQTVLLGVVAALVLAAAAYFFAIKPQLTQRADNQAETETAETMASTLNATISDLQRKRDALPDAEAQVSELTRKFPSNYQQDQWLRMIADAADKSGVKIVTITPTEPSDPAVESVPGAPAQQVDPNTGQPIVDTSFPVAQSTIALSAEGRTNEIQRFLRLLETMERPLLIDAVSYASQSSNLPRVEIVGKTFLSRALDNPLAEQDAPEDQ